MKKNRVCANLAFIVLASCGLSAAFADGMSDPLAARAACERRKEADTPEKLKKCCSNMILVAKLSDQTRLEVQCVQGKTDKQKTSGNKERVEAD